MNHMSFLYEKKSKRQFMRIKQSKSKSFILIFSLAHAHSHQPSSLIRINYPHKGRKKRSRKNLAQDLQGRGQQRLVPTTSSGIGNQ